MPHEAVQRSRSLKQNPGHGIEQNGMPVYLVDATKRKVTVKFGKELTAVDVESYVATLLTSPDFCPDFSEIVDLTEVEHMNLTADDFLKLADQVDPFSPHAKRAFVVRSSVQSHAARMHKILRTHQTVEIFRSVEEAERWIQG